jgi:hypothetical protein
MEVPVVAAHRSLLPIGNTFWGYAVEARIVEACRAPLQAFAARDREDRAVRIYCREVSGWSPAIFVRFRSELDRLRCIRHERIPRIVDGGLDDRLGWVVVEAIEGVSLMDAVLGGAFLEPMHVVMMLRDAVAALLVARDAGVLHGRLTPRLLLTSAAECRGVIEVGFDRLFGLNDMGHDIVFRAPEQLASRDELDERADIYALGVIGYFALGAQPFEDAAGVYDPVRLMRRILVDDLPSIASVRPDCPAAFEDLLRTMTAKLASNRPASLERLDEQLKGVLATCVAQRKGQGLERRVRVGAGSHAPTLIAPSSLERAREPEPAHPDRKSAPPLPEGSDHEGGEVRLRSVVLLVAALAGLVVFVALGAVLFARRTEEPSLWLTAPSIPAPVLADPSSRVEPPAPGPMPPSLSAEVRRPERPASKPASKPVGAPLPQPSSGPVETPMPKLSSEPERSQVPAIHQRVESMRYRQ